MMKVFKPLFCLAALLFPVLAGAAALKTIRSVEFKGLDGPVRLQNGQVVFSHHDQDGAAHNAVLLNPADASFRKVVAGVPGARFIAEDERYLVYTARGSRGNLLEVRDRRSGELASSVELRQNIQWGRIDGDRLTVLQAAGPYTTTAIAQVYTLPALNPQASMEITGGNDTAMWGDRIVSVGNSLSLYDAALRRIAGVELPQRDGRVCNGGPLRIAADKAVVGTDCGQLVVVDLPSAAVERVIAAGASARIFDVSDEVIFAAGSEDVAAFELASGVELARLPLAAEFVALHGNRLLAMQKTGRFPATAQFTLYEIDTADIKSETSRVARVQNGCAAVERALARGGDLHAAIEACEKSGIRGFIDSPLSASTASGAPRNYAVALTRTLSRYNEGLVLLERFASADRSLTAELAAGRDKARQLDPAADAPAAAEPVHVRRVPLDFGAMTDPVVFEGDRIYIARWLCHGAPAGFRGVVLDVLDRSSYALIKRVEVAECNISYHDAISAIIPVPGHVVLGLMYRLDSQERPNMAVVDAESLELKSTRFVAQEITRLKMWQGRLLACIGGQPGYRLDPESLSLKPATEAESRACSKGHAVGLGGKSGQSWSDSADLPAAETQRFHVYRVPGTLQPAYRIVKTGSPAKIHATLDQQYYLSVLPVARRDALVLSFQNGPYYRRYSLYDIARREESLLFELNPAGRPVLSEVWGDYLLVTLGRDLMVYDLVKRMTVKYEKGLMRETSAGGRGGVKRLLVDGDRLILAGLDDATARVIDLKAYLERLPSTDLFAPR